MFSEALPEPDLSEPAVPEEEDPKEEVYNPPNEVELPVVEEITVHEVIAEVPNNVAASVPVSAPAVPQEEAPKKSYASIVGFGKLLFSFTMLEITHV